jgi:hypothetical protein
MDTSSWTLRAVQPPDTDPVRAQRRASH